MKIEMHRSFERSYLSRIANNIKLKKKFKERLLAFEFDRKDPTLKDHALIGKKIGLRSFSITGDFRVVYIEISSDHVLLLDVGTHNQVY